MRIHAEVDIVNRLLPSLSLKGSKSGHAQLSVGRKPGADPTEGAVFLMICTAKDRNGAKYRVRLICISYHVIRSCSALLCS